MAEAAADPVPPIPSPPVLPYRRRDWRWTYVFRSPIDVRPVGTRPQR